MSQLTSFLFFSTRGAIIHWRSGEKSMTKRGANEFIGRLLVGYIAEE